LFVVGNVVRLAKRVALRDQFAWHADIAPVFPTQVEYGNSSTQQFNRERAE